MPLSDYNAERYNRKRINRSGDSIKHRIKNESIGNANDFGANYEEYPEWISVVSWWISVIIALFALMGLSVAHSENKNDPSFIAVIFGVFVCGLMAKGISHGLLIFIWNCCKIVKKGASIVAKTSSQKFDSIASSVSRKVSQAADMDRMSSRIVGEEELLRKKINDLEMQQLKKRVKDLEEQLKDR